MTLLERLIYAICVGSILYQFLLTAVIAFGFNTNYLKLFSAIVSSPLLEVRLSCAENSIRGKAYHDDSYCRELKDATVKVNNGFDTEKSFWIVSNLTIRGRWDFITILGGNGAGKSTLFNVIAGTLMLTSGQIFIMGERLQLYLLRSVPNTSHVFSKIPKWELLLE